MTYANVKTVDLTGEEVKVEGIIGYNTLIYNMSPWHEDLYPDDNKEYTIYASKYPNVVPNADNVQAILPGTAVLVRQTKGTVYLFGKGRAELHGRDSAHV